MTAEIELKLAFDPAAAPATVPAILRHPAIAAARAGRVSRKRLVSTYFDTPDWRLAKDGIALRIRRDGRRWLQTVKGPPLAGAGGALHARDEYEWPLVGPKLDASRFAVTPWQRPLANAVASGALGPRFTTDFERRALKLGFPDGHRAELAVDVGEIRTGGDTRSRQASRVPIAEAEIEVAAGDAVPLFALARALAADLPLAVGTADKALRGRALAQGDPDGWREPVRAQHVALDGNANAAQALAAIASECLRQIAANAAGLRHDDDPEWVHQMRVGTRRLRSCLALVASIAPKKRVAQLRAETKWLATILGRARDLDVFATETLAAAERDYATDAGTNAAGTAAFRRISARVARERRKARAAAREAVASKRFTALVLDVGALAATPRFGAPAREGGADPAAAPARTFAADLLARRQRKLEARIHEALGADAAARHALRIAAKKQRYAAEFFAPLFPGGRTRKYIGALELLQEVLGRGNDIATATKLAAEFRIAGDDSAAVALHQALGASAAKVERDLARVTKRFVDTRHFWL